MKKTFLLIIVYCLLTTAMPVFAQPATDYKLLAPIPLKGVGAGETTQTKAGPYIEGIFMLAIAIAGGLAVIKIIFGGIKYLTSEAFTGKSDAKETIQNAIWGLLLVISAWIILYTINPKLVKFDLKIEAQSVGTGGAVTGGVGGTPGSSGGLGSNLTGNGRNPLSGQEIRDRFATAGVIIEGNIKVDGMREGVVNELVKLKQDCGCDVTVTSATGGAHSTKYACNHADGYKADVRTNGNGAKLTNYIKQNYKQVVDAKGNPVLRDGDPMWTSSAGGVYVYESNHWDVAVC